MAGYRLTSSSSAGGLRARLLKDSAYETAVVDNVCLAEAAEAYRAIFQKTGRYFPGINAASMLLPAGDAAAASIAKGFDWKTFAGRGRKSYANQ
jgi:hypothetical protein